MAHLTEQDLESMYEDMLNEVYGQCSIAGVEFDTAHALKELDPIMFDCGCSEYIDSLLQDGVLFEKDGEYYDDEADVLEQTEESEE